LLSADNSHNRDDRNPPFEDRVAAAAIVILCSTSMERIQKDPHGAVDDEVQIVDLVRHRIPAAVYRIPAKIHQQTVAIATYPVPPSHPPSFTTVKYDVSQSDELMQEHSELVRLCRKDTSSYVN
jgi:hypothetical protein